MNIKIDLTSMFENENGEKTKETLAKFLSNFLYGETSGDALKLGHWARDLQREGIIEIDKTDYDMLYKLVKDTPRWSVILKLQILEALQEAEKKPRGPKFDKMEVAQPTDEKKAAMNGGKKTAQKTV